MRLRTLSSAAVLLAAIAVRAQAPDTNVITAVEVQDAGDSVMVSIKGSKPPNFTTFSMMDPPRFVIDLSETTFKNVPGDIQPGGVIQVIKNLSYGAEATAIARVMIAFTREVDPPDVQTSGETLLVKVMKPAGMAVAQVEPVDAAAPRKAQEEPAKADSKASAAQESQAKADAAQRSKAEEEAKARAAAAAPAAAPAGAAVAGAAAVASDDDAKARAAAEEQRRLEAQARAEREAKARAEEERVKAEADALARTEAEARAKAEAERRASAEWTAQARELAGAPPAGQAAAEPAPAAVVAALTPAQTRAQARAEAKARAEEEARARAEAKAQARAEAKANAEEAARAKAEAKAQARAEAKAKAEEEARARAERRAARARGAEVAALAPGAAAASPEPPLGGPNQIREIGFRQLAEASRVFVRTSAEPRFTIREAGDNVIRVEFSNTHVQRRNDTRFLDTSFFPTAVALVSPRREGSTYVVEIKLKQKVPYQQKIEGDTLAIDFERPAGLAASAAPGAPAPEAAPPEGEVAPPPAAPPPAN